jgi:hypothetical protein
MCNYNFNYLLIIALIVFIAAGYCQRQSERLGKVTYKSLQNVYVQFENTEGILQGDTLYAKINGKFNPAVQVNFISTRSCAGISIIGDKLKINDELYAVIKIKPAEENIIIDTNLITALPPKTENQPVIVNKSKSINPGQNNSSGRISVQSYSSFNPGKLQSEDQRWRYTFSYGSEEIGQTGLSFSTYFNYAYAVGEWHTIKQELWNNLKVYDLCLGYDFDEETTIKIGRFLNPKVSNISSVDGLQFQKKFSNYYSGLIIGSRPDFVTLGFNPELFEYGGYIGRTDTIDNILMENTVAFFQQTNNSKTDRRFIYFQHNNSLLKNLNMYISSEIDLYTLVNGEGKNKPTLTSLFLSAYYSPVRMISFSLSYDARKNVIYYETFKNSIDSLFENETRQGLRFGTNIRPFNNLLIGLNVGYRFLTKDIKPSKNFNGNITYSQIPYVEVSPSFSYSRLISNYVDGSIYGIRVSKYFSFIDYSLSFSYTKVQYDYLSSSTKLNQNNFAAEISGRIWKQLFLSCSYEGVFEEELNYSRIFIDLGLRF